MDTARLFWPALILSVYLLMFHWILVVGLPYLLLLIIAYGVMFSSIRDTGKYIKYLPALVVVDFIILLFAEQFPINLLLVWPAHLVLLIVLVLLIRAVRQEMFYFDRTIFSMNDEDKKHAREALKSGDPAAGGVADYTGWDSVR